MRIAVVSHDVFWPLRGGGGVRVYWVTRSLAAKGHRLRVVAPVLHRNGMDDAFRNIRIQSIGQVTRFVRMKELVYAWIMVRIFVKLLPGSYDVMYAHNVVAALPALLAGKLKGIPVVFDMDDLLTGYSKNPLVYRLGPFLERWVARRTNAVVVTSRIAENCCKAWGVKTVYTVRHGVDLSRFFPRDRARKYVCFTGGMEVNDGVLLIPDAAREVLRHHPETVFLFAGEGKEQANLNRRIRELGLSPSFRILGWVDQSTVAELLNQSLIGLITSLEVSATVFSSPLRSYEYMAVGLPFVASDLDGIREQVEASGAGILFRNGDATALAEAILMLLDNGALRRDLGRNGRKFVEAHCDWNENAFQIGRICEKSARV